MNERYDSVNNVDRNNNQNENFNHTNDNGNASGEYHYSYRPAANPYQPVYTTPPTNGETDPFPPKKTKRSSNPKKFGFGSLLAVVLCAAILCSGISAAVTASIVKNQVTEEAQKAAETTALSTVEEQLKNTGNVSNTTNVTVNDESDSIAETVAKKTLPSVVGIKVTAVYTSNFFGQSYSSTGEGSGVIYREDGYIITNYHVISSAVDEATYGSLNENASIEVYFYNETENAYPATVVGYDASADLALLKVDRTGLPAIETADSSKLSVGEVAIAIGSPGGLAFMGSVSKGIISGLNRTITTESGVEMNLIQTDASINPGNSGGALVNSEGKLVGINNSKMSGDDFEGMGFAIPVNEVVDICERFLTQEGSPEAYLGVSVNTYYTSERLQSMGYPAGVVVYSVAEDSPAAEAGIQAGDIITAINGQEISSYAAMISEKNKYNAGDTITVTVYSNRTSKDLSVTLGTSH